MLILGSMILWRTTGQGAPPPPPPQPTETPAAPIGGGFPANDRARSREEISRARARFGLKDAIAQAIAEVAERQAAAELAAQAAEKAAADEQKRFDELFRELEMRQIAFEARHLEALATMREEALARLRKQREEEEIFLLLLAAAAAAT